MSKRPKKAPKSGGEAGESVEAFAGEINPFENPEAALEAGSDEQLAILAGNDIEAPAEDESFEAGGSQELREKIKTMIRSADELYWDLAQAISKVANERLYKSWGYKSFESYVNEECKIDKRKGQYFVQIHNYFESTLRTILINHSETYDHYLAVAKRMGWVKARILAKEQVVTEDNAEALLDKIKNCTVRELEDICAVAATEMSSDEADKRTDENVDKLVRMAFQCTLAQKDDIEKAIEHAKSIIGRSDTSRSSALAWAARSYLDFDVISRGGKVSITDHLASAERAFDVSLVAIDHGAGKIVFGESNLHKLAHPEAEPGN